MKVAQLLLEFPSAGMMLFVGAIAFATLFVVMGCAGSNDAGGPDDSARPADAQSLSAADLWAQIQSPLTGEENRVLCEQGTEPKGTGHYTDHEGKGLYACRACGASLYRSGSKFRSSCGWPAFDDEIDGAVRRLPDPDGRRTEIRCAACDGHLGHVFTGDEYTDTNTRHCVNSISMVFIPADVVAAFETLRARQ